MDWTKRTSDPLCLSTKKEVKSHLSSLQVIYKGKLSGLFAEISRGKEVLHVGCYEHDEKYFMADEWKHKVINDAASYCLGVDVNKTGIEKMISAGYNAICMDATSNSDIGKQFDVIIVGDVIEHLTNILGLIDFCKRHLKCEGLLIISTPNPFFIEHVLASWFSGPMVANFEHTCWLTESNILEISRRNNLNLSSIYYATGNTTSNPFIYMLKRIIFMIKSTMFFTTVVYQMGFDWRKDK